MILSLETRFVRIYRQGQRDDTLRTDIPENIMFSAALHLMLADAARYAVGLVYTKETVAEEDLRMMKDIQPRQYTVRDAQRSA